METVRKSLTSKVSHRLAKGAYGRYVLKRAMRQSPCRIVIGACGGGQDGWTPTEYEVLNMLKLSNWSTYFRPGSIDALMAEHVWEHLTWEEGIEAARNCFVYLKPGGYLRVAVPDGNHPSEDYIDWIKPNGIGPGCEDHKVLFDHQSLKRMFEAAGFVVRVLEYFDEQGQFHFDDWRPEDGLIYRSWRFDKRNTGGLLTYTSIILDAFKPNPGHMGDLDD